jgi:iron complex transport system permease protein
VANGAGLGVNLALLGFLPGFFSALYFIPFWGFLGASLSIFIVLVLAKGLRQSENAGILLLGISVSILLNSLNTLLTFWASRQQEVRHILFWAFGNLDKSDWQNLTVAALFSLPALIFLFLQKRKWNILLLGEEKAYSLGQDPAKLKNGLLVLSALLTSSVVCFVGPIGFVGLVVPFFTRKWIPITQSGFWRLTFCTGGLFISLCDLISRIAFRPYGLPIGLVSSLVGVPFFVYLLRDSSRKSSF